MSDVSKKIVIIATGGTIAGIGEKGKTTGYVPGELSTQELISAVPMLEKIADIEVIELCNINSDDITYKLWVDMVRLINEKANDPEISGFVITHGTDVLEETAFFLQLLVKTDKPVVLTGAMRPASALSADGAMNLYQAVLTAACREAIGRGVMVTFSNQIYSARYMSKNNTNSMTAMSGGIQGCMGTIIDDEIFFHYHIDACHTTKSEFDIDTFKPETKIAVVYFEADDDCEILKYSLANYDGIVIAGAGMGEYSKLFIDCIQNAAIPVVISSRTGNGVITQRSLLNSQAITAVDLNPQKAAILLKVALGKYSTNDEIQKIYYEY